MKKTFAITLLCVLTIIVTVGMAGILYSIKTNEDTMRHDYRENVVWISTQLERAFLEFQIKVLEHKLGHIDRKEVQMWNDIAWSRFNTVSKGDARDIMLEIGEPHFIGTVQNKLNEIDFALTHNNLDVATEVVNEILEMTRDISVKSVVFNNARVASFRERNANMFSMLVVMIVCMVVAGVVIVYFMINEKRILRTYNNELETRVNERTHELYTKANYDDVTGIPNRAYMIDYINRHVKQFPTRHIGTLFVDLDRFKLINDTFGHACGDKLLSAAADRIQDVLRENDLVGRFGGDEFVIILNNIKTKHTLHAVADKLVKAFTDPFFIEDKEMMVTASVGMSFYPTDGKCADSLLKNADTAMYKAKASGRNGSIIFSQDMESEIKETSLIERYLRKSVEKRELSLTFQGIHDTKTGDMVSCESLLRWEHPELGFVPPDKFIPIAEETGAIIDIGRWVLDEACRAGVRIQKRTGKPIHMSVNISPAQLREGIHQTVAYALKQSGFDPCCLHLELTESILINHSGLMVDELEKIAGLGVSLSIDDFGTGYSSLSYLREYPIDTMKVDRAFVTDVTTDKDAAALARAIMSVGKSLDLKIIGEGVETEEHMKFLRDAGCDYVQGYYFSKPLFEAEFLAKIN